MREAIKTMPGIGVRYFTTPHYRFAGRTTEPVVHVMTLNETLHWLRATDYTPRMQCGVTNFRPSYSATTLHEPEQLCTGCLLKVNAA